MSRFSLISFSFCIAAIIASQAAFQSPASAVDSVGGGPSLLNGGGANGGNGGGVAPTGARAGGQIITGPEAQAMANSFRNGKGWVFATCTDRDANGGRFVRYQVAKDPSTVVNNRGLTEGIDVRVEPESEWIYDSTGQMPIANGPADQVFARANAQLEAHQNGTVLLHETTRGQMQQLWNQIHPTIAHAPPQPQQPQQPQQPAQPPRPQRPPQQPQQPTLEERAGVEALDFFLRNMIEAGRNGGGNQTPPQGSNNPGLDALEVILP